MKLVLGLVLLGWVTGCGFFVGPWPREGNHVMPADTACRSDYELGAVYRLRHHMPVIAVPSDYKEMPDIDLEYDPSRTTTVIRDFEHKSGNYPYIVAVLPAGSKIRFEKMVVTYSPVAGTYACPLVRSTDPELSKLGLINAGFISLRDGYAGDLPSAMVDPALLEKESAAPGTK